jgi:hypothetical protein
MGRKRGSRRRNLCSPSTGFISRTLEVRGGIVIVVGRLPLKIQLNTIGRRGRYTRSEEVAVFCPDRAIECQRDCGHRPVVFVTPCHAFSCAHFKVHIEGIVYYLNPVAYPR